MIEQKQIIGDLRECPIQDIFLMIANISGLQDNKNRRSEIGSNLGFTTSSVHYIL
jgi:hypothetical protein